MRLSKQAGRQPARREGSAGSAFRQDDEKKGRRSSFRLLGLQACLPPHADLIEVRNVGGPLLGGQLAAQVADLAAEALQVQVVDEGVGPLQLRGVPLLARHRRRRRQRRGRPRGLLATCSHFHEFL